MISGKLRVRHVYHRKLLGTSLWLCLAIIPFLLMAAGCGEPGQGPFRSTGAYPIDIFQEMHYNQTHKAQEPPRLSPPPDSIPIDGAERDLPVSKVDAKTLENPLSPDATALDRAGTLYHINCATCHGDTANGDGYVGQKFAEHGASVPPAFNSERIAILTPGEAYWSISKGYPAIPEGLPTDIGPEVLSAFQMMPPFANLLSPEDRWLLVYLISLSQDERESLLSTTKAPGG